MISFRGRVQFKDGSEVEFESGTAALAAWERYALRNGFPVGDQSRTPGTLAALVIAHKALGIEEGFDVWEETVNGIELTADGVPPTLPEPTAAS